jgi:hypothetical protein
MVSQSVRLARPGQTFTVAVMFTANPGKSTVVAQTEAKRSNRDQSVSHAVTPATTAPVRTQVVSAAPRSLISRRHPAKGAARRRPSRTSGGVVRLARSSSGTGPRARCFRSTQTNAPLKRASFRRMRAYSAIWDASWMQLRRRG